MADITEADSLSQYFKTRDRQEAEATAIVTSQAAKESADRASTVLTLAAANGVHPDTITATTQPFFENELRQRRDKLMLSSAPRLRGWLGEDFNNARVAHDDLPALGWWETKAGETAQLTKQVGASAIRMIGSHDINEGLDDATLSRDMSRSWDEIYADTVKEDDSFNVRLSKRMKAQGVSDEAMQRLGVDPHPKGNYGETFKRWATAAVAEAYGADPKAHLQARVEQGAWLVQMADKLAGTNPEAAAWLEKATVQTPDFFGKDAPEAAPVGLAKPANIFELKADDEAGTVLGALKADAAHGEQVQKEQQQLQPVPDNGLQAQTRQALKAVAEDPRGFLSFALSTVADSAAPMIGGMAATVLTKSPAAGIATMGVGNFDADSVSTLIDGLRAVGFDIQKPGEIKRLVYDNPQVLAKQLNSAKAKGIITTLGAMVTMGVGGRALMKNPVTDHITQSVVQSVIDGSFEAASELAAGQSLQPLQIIGEMAGGVIEVPAVGVTSGKYVRDRAVGAIKAQQTSEFFHALSGQASTSKLRIRMPEKFQDFVTRATEGGPVENLYVKGTEFGEYFQSQGIDPKAALAELGLKAEDLDTALATGGDIVIPTAKYAATMAGTAHDQFMLDNMRLRPEDMSAKEAMAFQSVAGELIAQAQAEAQNMSLAEMADVGTRDQIRSEIATRLQGAGRAADVARVEGAYYAELYATMAQRTGMSVDELVAQIPLPNFQGATPLSAAPRDNSKFAQTMALLRQRAARPVTAPARTGEGTGAVQEEVSSAAPVTPIETMLDAVPTGVVDTGSTDTVQGAAPDVDGPAVLDEAVGATSQGDGAGSATQAETGGAAANPADNASPTNSPEDAKLDEVETYLDSLGLSLDNTDEEIRRAVQADANRIAGERSFNQAITLRKGGDENLSRYGLEPGKKYTTRQIAMALEKRQREKFGTIDRKDQSPEAQAKIAKWMVEEAIYEIEQLDPSKSGVGWYSTKFQNALDEFGAQFPELVDETWVGGTPGLDRLGSRKAARNFLTALIAVTSDGNKVKQNFVLAARAYGKFRDTGSLEGVDAYRQAINGNIAEIGRLLDQFGPDGMTEFLMRQMTVKDMKKIAAKAGVKLSVNYPANRVLPQAAVVFGPKLGAFYANLMGAEGYLTMDRWWSRTFNRYRGQLLTSASPSGIARVKELLGDPEMGEAEFVARITEVAKAYGKKGFKNGTELEKAANTVAKDMGLTTTGTEDAPFSTSDRGFMIDTTALAQKMLAERGHTVTIADIQAILWYFEKRLLGDLGARETPDISYEDAAKEIVDGNDTGPAAAAEDGPSSETDLEFSDGGIVPADDGDLVSADPGGRSYGQGPAQVQVRADTENLAGLPPGNAGQNERITQAARDYLTSVGIPYRRQARYVQVDKARATRIAQAFEEMKHDPENPEVKAAYDQLVTEVKAQYQAVLDMGLQIEVIEPGLPDPYPEGPRQVLEDLQRGHIWLYPTDAGFGSGNTADDNPLLAPTDFYIGERRLLANDLFRVVHDVFGHGREGVGFGASGEENTWQSHVRMFSPLAARAMTTETRGQNSWVNYGPHGETNRANPKETVYADQKIGLLPDWAVTEGIEDDPVSAQGRTYDQAAFHGSPHVHDSFDLDRLGTGEGIHDHGWGFYFSKAEAGADLYRSTYARPTITTPAGERVTQALLNKKKGRQGDLLRDAFNRVKVIGLEAATREAVADTAARPHNPHAKAIAKVLMDWAGSSVTDEGRTFTVDVPEDTELLNYDGTQSDLVARSLEKAGIDGTGSGRAVYERLARRLGSDRRASEALRNAGIPGLRYAKGSGELVVWDQSRVRIQAVADGGRNARPHLFDQRPSAGFAQPEKVALTPDEQMARLKAQVPYKTVEDLITAATEVDDQLQNMLAMAAQRAGGTAKRGPIKRLEDAHSKMARKGYKAAGEITDAIRGTISISTPQQAEDAVAALRSMGEVVDEGWKVIPSSGYFDRKLSLVMPNGVIAEVQLLERTMLQAKKEGHRIYKEARDLPDGDPRRMELEFKSQQLYGQAQAALADTAWSSTLASFGNSFAQAEGSMPSIQVSAAANSSSDAGATTQETPLADPSNPPGPSAIGDLSSVDQSVPTVQPVGNSYDMATSDITVQEPGAVDNGSTDPMVKEFAQGGGLARGRINIPQGGITHGATISIFQSADLSTVIHETGHFMLEMLRHFNSLPNAPEQIKADYQALMSWHVERAEDVARDANKAYPDAGVTADDVKVAIADGTTGDGAKDAAIDAGMHEQFAKAAEAYVMEGRAPSVALQPVLTRFMAWLSRLYRSMKSFGVEMTPEIREVFDRMLATDKAILEAQDTVATNDMIFKSADAAGMSPEAYAVLSDLHERAKASATANLLREAMAPVRREKVKTYKAEKTRVKNAVTEELRQEPVYRTIQELRYGKTFEGEELEQPVKLSTKAIEEDYGAGYVALMPGTPKDGKGSRWAMHSNVDGAMHPDTVAGMYGFDTGKELIEAVTSAPPIEEAIRAETEKRMFAAHGDVLNDGTIELKAMDAIHNDERMKLIAAELEHLHAIAGKGRAMTWQQAKSAAQTILRDTPVGIASPARYLAAERKAARRSIELMAIVTRSELWTQAVQRKAQTTMNRAVANDNPAGLVNLPGQVNAANEKVAKTDEHIDKLIQSKQQQLLNHALYNGARQVQKEMDKLLSRLAKLNRGDKRVTKGVDVDHVRAARAIASKFGLAKADPSFQFQAWLDQLGHENPMAQASMATAITTWTQDAKPYKQLTVDEISAVWDAISNILSMGKHAKQIEIQGKAMDKELAITEMTQEMTSRSRAQNTHLAKTHTAGDKLKVRALGIMAGLRRVEHWARDLDGQKVGPFTRYLVRPVMDAVDQYRAAKNVRVKELVDIIEPMRKTLRGQAIKADELGQNGFTFANKGELLHAVLHSGNESNLRKLLVGYRWGTLDEEGKLDSSKWTAFVNRMVVEGVLTKADFDFAQKVWNLMESTKRDAQTAHRKMYGYYFNEIEASPVVTPFGIYKGGYVPAVGDRYASVDGATREGEDIMASQQTAAMFPSTGNGFTKNRVANYATPLALDLGLLPAHLDKVLRFTHLGPTIQQTASLLMDRGFKAAMHEMDPVAIGTMLLPWLQRTATQAMETPSTTEDGRAADAFWRHARRSSGLGTMFLNIVNTLQQLTGIFPSLITTSAASTTSSMTRFAKDASAMRKEMMDASPFMKDRTTTGTREMMTQIENAIVPPTKIAEVNNWVNKHGYFMQQSVQSIMDTVVWHAAYNDAIAAGKTHEDAVYEGDSVVRRTQGDMNPENVSKYETGSAFKRMFTMFFSYFNGQANLIGSNAKSVMHAHGWSGTGKLFYIYLMGVMAPAVASQLIANAFRGWGDDDKDKEDRDWVDWGAMFFGAQLQYSLNMLPVVGNITNAFIARMNNTFWDDKLNVTPVLQQVDRATNLGKDVKKGINKGTWGDLWMDGLLTLGFITGIPTGQLAKTTRYGVDVATGEAKPEGIIDVAQGVVSGRDGTKR